jgi:gluconokinase
MQVPKTIIVMGVSGSGKSHIGALLAQALGGVFEDADAFHPPANIAKMGQGIPLVDEDRWPWLQALRQRILFQRQQGFCYVLACSALKQCYRDLLRGDDGPELHCFVYLQGSIELIRQRMERRDHFMPSSLLESQFATLEEPLDALVIGIEASPAAIVAQVVGHLTAAEP